MVKVTSMSLLRANDWIADFLICFLIAYVANFHWILLLAKVTELPV